MEFTLAYGNGQYQACASKRAAIDLARELNLTSFEVIDEWDAVVYQEFPEVTFV